MSGWSYGPGEARAVQMLARHQMIARLLADVAQDMTICKLEGWDVWEYPRMLFEAIPVPPAEGRWTMTSVEAREGAGGGERVMAEFLCDFFKSDIGTELVKRERIVRCRDCKHGDPFCECSSYPGKIDCLHFAQWNHYDDEPGVCVMEPDDFCSYGVMRDGD